MKVVYNLGTRYKSDNNYRFKRRFDKMKVNVNTLNLALARSCMTKKELANKSGVDIVTISRIISKTQKPRPKTIGKIAKALDVPVEILIDEY